MGTCKVKLSHLFLAAMLALCSCTCEQQQITPPEPQEEDSGFAKGADVSWLTQLESEGYIFTDHNGVQTECMQLLKEQCGVNSIRLRVWVNPVDGWNNADDVLAKARRADALGLRLMIDFHFSDTWADPGHQTIPAAWADYGIEEMKSAVADHVTSVLNKLKAFKIEPEWVQIGNESSTGMLWPLGKYTNGNNYAALSNAGYDAAKAVCPDAKVIIHLHSGDALSIYTTIFDYMYKYGGKYDLIGVSLYPSASSWKSTIDSFIKNITTLYDKYGKNVMVCEIGMNYSEAEECRDCIAYLMKEGRATGHMDGIFYWEPEAPEGYNGGYDKGCFRNGTPTVALDAFME